jgi:uncharacterized membrane protein (DUF4010 family)
MSFDQIDIDLIQKFAIALLLGALVGVEREKKKSRDGDQGIGGFRTFILLAEVGAVSAWISQVTSNGWIFAITVLGVSAAVVAGYLTKARMRSYEVGMTTEIAAILVCLLGGATIFGYPEMAVVLAVATSATLAYKEPLHGMVSRFEKDDIYAGVKLLIATFIILPLLPNETIDPWEVINPARIWWLVILISSLSLVGYVLTRWLGTGKGSALTGLTGGLVSSTAVSLTFARRSHEEPRKLQSADALACGILLAWSMMFVRIGIEVTVVHAELLRLLLAPLLVLLAATLTLAGWFFWCSGRQAGENTETEHQVTLRNPFSLYSASKFALFFVAVQFLVRIAQEYTPNEGMYLVAGLAGLTDVDAITLSMADFARRGGAAGTATTAIAIAAFSNTIVKCTLLLVLGSRALAGRIAGATAILLICGAVATVVTLAL